MHDWANLLIQSTAEFRLDFVVVQVFLLQSCVVVAVERENLLHLQHLANGL